MGVWDSVRDFGESYVLPAANAAGGIAQAALPAASKVGKAIPLIGTAVGVGQGLYHGAKAWNSEGDEYWDHVGAATLGALGAIPGVGTYLGAGELGWNIGAAAATGGMSNAQEAGGNSGQMVGGLMRRGLNMLNSDWGSDDPVLGRRDEFWRNQRAQEAAP
jgi:hypothetical protein